MGKFEATRTRCPKHTEDTTLPPADLPSHDTQSCFSLRDPSTPLPEDGDSGHPVGWLAGKAPMETLLAIRP